MTAPSTLHRSLELAGTLPALMVAADRVAATVIQGVHGRRRVGQGDAFWQYRPYREGDSASQIDWRKSWSRCCAIPISAWSTKRRRNALRAGSRSYVRCPVW